MTPLEKCHVWACFIIYVVLVGAVLCIRQVAVI